MKRCRLCPGIHKCLAPDGPPSDLLLVGEAPGKQEQRAGRIFVGRSGQELDRHYLPLAGLQRWRVQIANAICCLPPGAQGKIDLKQAKDRALLECCANTHLYPLIERTRPKVLVAMGAFACHALNPDIDLELQHGFPSMSPWGIPIFPMYHPAVGLHEPKRMLLLRNDWMRLKQFLAGKLSIPADPYPKPDYVEITDPEQLEDLDVEQPLACDTEITKAREPFCLTYSQQPGTGRLIRASRPDLLAIFQSALARWKGPVLFHNWLFDRPVTRAMGLLFPENRIVDTMVRVFHLGNLPQGLKALAYRELGMRMQDFDDLVRPHSTKLVLEYFRMAQELTWPKPTEELVRDDKGHWKVYKPQGLNTKLKRFFTDFGKNAEKDVFQTWDNWEASQRPLEDTIGPFPGLCITHAPFSQVLAYSCRDADATLRLYPILEHMRKGLRRRPQERWRETS